MEERVLLVGCQTQQTEDEFFQSTMAELEALVKTAGGVVTGTLTQKRERIESATYIGSGKIEELAFLVEETEAELVIFNDELTPSQIRNLSREVEARVIDRTQLILDIFAQRAQTKEGKLQVELAQLEYLLPRLGGQGIALSRQGGGIGARGPGETKLETDRRHIRERITEMKRSLHSVQTNRELHREKRRKSDVFHVAIVGYTNAGKSTTFNQLTQADVFEEDALFATLDATTRKCKLPSGTTVILSDTVGFIQKLPTTLIASFRSTLEEVLEADVLLHVVDGSHEQFNQQIQTVHKILQQLGASQIPEVLVLNKKDKMTEDWAGGSSAFRMSALDPDDIAHVKQLLEQALSAMLVPYEREVPSDEGGILAKLRRETVVSSMDFEEQTNMYRVAGFERKKEASHDMESY
ncbi:GTPase HflX [Bacillus fonticola]|uniref:GTPase HflX n=1 Tax=Bacillus fonticola TaxID=2728853 RepID=UPI001475DD38|nr:GTPase HflX [Bacillus fonticola]